MQLFLAFVKYDDCTLFEISQESIFNLIGDFIEEAPEILMAIIVVKDPP
jgi:hypothetical protein